MVAVPSGPRVAVPAGESPTSMVCVLAGEGASEDVNALAYAKAMKV